MSTLPTKPKLSLKKAKTIPQPKSTSDLAFGVTQAQVKSWNYATYKDKDGNLVSGEILRRNPKSISIRPFGYPEGKYMRVSYGIVAKIQPKPTANQLKKANQAAKDATLNADGTSKKTKADFGLGQTVEFSFNGGTSQGVIEKLNPKRALVAVTDDDGQVKKFTCPYNNLTVVAGIAIQDVTISQPNSSTKNINAKYAMIDISHMGGSDMRQLLFIQKTGNEQALTSLFKILKDLDCVTNGGPDTVLSSSQVEGMKPAFMLTFANGSADVESVIQLHGKLTVPERKAGQDAYSWIEEYLGYTKYPDWEHIAERVERIVD